MKSVLLLAGLGSVCFAQSSSSSDFFEAKVRPVFLARCSSCHGDKVQMGQKQFTSADTMHRSGAIVPGDPEASPLIQAVRYGGKVKMPPSGKLPQPEIDALEKWVREGAVWPAETAMVKKPAASSYWALNPVKKPVLPTVKDSAWGTGAIDRFILAKLEEKHLPVAPDADRYALLRRVTLDLTGLLPTAEDVSRFVKDASPVAFETVVDRLLNSPAFGERWGRHWLDITYWADTTGVGRRIPLREAWRYRDYVIRSFANDKPYDRFVREQIAGPGKGSQEDALAATGFLVLGPWAWFAYDKVQTRADIVDLQVDMVGRTVMGLTIGCARCHDHKFDPITNKDYFAMTGIFLSTKTTSRTNEEGGINLVRLPENASIARAHAEALEAWEKRVAQAETDDKVFKKEQEAVRKRIEELKKPPASEENAAAVKAAEKELAELKKKTEFAGDRQIVSFIKYMKPTRPETYAAEEMEVPENARIAVRGDAHQLGDFVPRGFLSAVSTGQPVPEIDPHSSGRTELADWLTDPGHPLTARVYVNRIWHHLFGRGIVATTDNFGARGEPPTHPELLDYLAVRFVEEGWSTKRLIREIVSSRVYRLSTRGESRNEETDAANLFLWRANRRRLEAEAIRDAILQISGDLDSARGGPSLPLTAQNVHTIAPYFLEDDSRIQPGVKYRRTVYQPIMRNSQMEDIDILNLFDFKDPDQIVGARSATTVPTQMLYLMNSPFVKDGARMLADSTRMLDDRARVAKIVMDALSRPATQRDFDQAKQFVSDFRAAAAQQKDPPSDPDLEAWARYCHAIFVSSEFLYRR